jgi:DNA repair exonuclease SbcCD nuclease subunit
MAWRAGNSTRAQLPLQMIARKRETLHGMPRLLHMADVHLGARHDDLGPAAAAQRERQFTAFHKAIELAISEKVDLVLIAGDLFDSNAQPRRSVERAASELARLSERQIPVVIIPGTHDCYEPSSIYRVFDIPALARSKHGSQTVTVLTDTRPRIDFPHLELTVHGLVSATKRAAQSPLANFSAIRAGAVEAGGGSPSDDRASATTPLAWQVGMIHGSLAVPGKFDQDDVMFNEAEVAASGLHYLALGHWHSFREGRAGNTVWAYSGAPEPVAVDQDGAGQVLIVELADRNGRATVTVQPQPVGRTKFEKLELDAAAITSQGELEQMLRERADPDRVLDVRLVGVKPDQIDLNVDELERQLNGSFLRLRVRDSSVAALPEAQLAPADTIIGAFTRDFGARIADHEARGDTERAAELREALRLGTLLLDDPHRVTLA